MSSESMQRVSLTTELFQKALDRYIDYHKPDPICRKQLEGWLLTWSDDETDGVGKTEFLPDPLHILKGQLEIGGEYVVISLRVECYWKSTGPAESEHSPFGRFFFSCHASARFWTKSELNEKRQKETNNETETSKSDKKTEEKIRSKMIARFRQDAYLSKLLNGTAEKDSSKSEALAAKKGILGPLLAQAKIQFSDSDLEERVTVSEDVCEAIKRAVWSSVESPLDVVEVLLHMPFLPTTDHKSSDSFPIETTPLANRAKLRLLEDAMCDACEKEEEDELLDDLNISEDGASKPSGTPEIDEDRDWTTVPSKKSRGNPKK